MHGINGVVLSSSEQGGREVEGAGIAIAIAKLQSQRKRREEKEGI